METMPKTQCLFSRGEWMTVCWIPKKLAVKKNSVKIGKNLWTVEETYGTMEESALKKAERVQREFERLIYDLD